MSLTLLPDRPSKTNLQNSLWQKMSEGLNDVRNETEPVTFADLKIRTKDKRLVPFTPNEVQTRYLDILTEQYKDKCGFDWRNGIYTLRGIREDVLKARQQGMSTLWLALYFLDTINNPLTESHVYAHDGETTIKLFQVIHRFYTNLPIEKRRPTKYYSKNSVVFADTESGIYVGMVGGNALGRGGTVNNAHLSERAWNDRYAELEVGLLQAIPEGGNVTRETTANGFNEYYTERLRGHAGESRFRPRFFGWNLHSEYQMDAQQNDLSDEERKLAASYDLSVNQVAWRREKIKDLKEKFQQEYPISEAEAFLSSGNPYFDRTRLLAISEAIAAGSGEMTDFVIPPTYPELRRAYRDGKLKLRQIPKEGHYYVIGADTAEGLTQDDRRDYSCADVLDVQTWEQVATLHGQWDEHTFGVMCAELGFLYNTALLGIERNYHGVAVIEAALHTGKYPAQVGRGGTGLYYHDGSMLEKRHETTNADVRKAGWPTTQQTKIFALDKLNEAIESEDLTINDRQTVNECLTFVDLPGGKAGGEKGMHDDRVISLSIACALLNLRFERGRRPGGEDNWKPPTPTGSGAFVDRRRGV